MNSLHGRAWILWISVMSTILGMLIAASLKTQQQVQTVTGVRGLRFDELAGLYTNKNRENQRLRQQISDLENKNTELLNAMANRNKDASVFNVELQDAKLLAGLTEVEGPGLLVTLTDSQKKVAENDPLGPMGYLIHDLDIRDVVNELRAAGAEAVSVNKQRLTSTSAIRCAGPVTLINDVDIAAPFQVKAIGDPKTLESALRMPGGVVARMPDPKMISIEQAESIKIEAYNGSRRLQWARMVQAHK